MIALLPKEDQPRATEINDMLKAEITKVGGDTKSVEQVCEYVSSICETLCKRNEFDNESWLGAIPSYLNSFMSDEDANKVCEAVLPECKKKWEVVHKEY